MRLPLLVVAICVGFVGMETSAEAQNYPWCALYKNGGQNCGFTAFQQCQAALSGGADFCQPNTLYVPPTGPAFLEQGSKALFLLTLIFSNGPGSLAIAIRRASNLANTVLNR